MISFHYNLYNGIPHQNIGPYKMVSNTKARISKISQNTIPPERNSLFLLLLFLKAAYKQDMSNPQDY